MANVRIEYDRGHGWQLRGEGEATDEQAAAIDLTPYCLQYAHRLIVDGVVVAEMQPKKRRQRGK